MRIVKSPDERRHHAFARENHAPDFYIRRRRAAGKYAALEYGVQVGRSLLELQIVLFVAVSATHRVEMLACSLLRSQRRRCPASDERARQTG